MKESLRLKNAILLTIYNKQEPTVLIAGHSLAALGTVDLFGPLVIGELKIGRSLNCHIQSAHSPTGTALPFNSS